MTPANWFDAPSRRQTSVRCLTGFCSCPRGHDGSDHGCGGRSASNRLNRAQTPSPGRAEDRRLCRRALLLVAASVAAVLVTAIPALAVTDGELDGNGHPAVVLILMEVNGAPAFRCSGTLIAPTYVLTAGHCAGAPGEFSGMRIFTESDVQAGIGTTNNYPLGSERTASRRSALRPTLYSRPRRSLCMTSACSSSPAREPACQRVRHRFPR